MLPLAGSGLDPKVLIKTRDYCEFCRVVNVSFMVRFDVRVDSRLTLFLACEEYNGNATFYRETNEKQMLRSAFQFLFRVPMLCRKAVIMQYAYSFH